MKRSLPILISIIFIANLATSQVEVGKTKNTIMGKSKIIGQIENELTLDDFGITINLYAYGEDKGGGMGSSATATVGVRTHLSDVDEPLAQEIANEAYAYFVEAWKKRGVTVAVPSKSEIEKSKNYAKAAKKGKANINSGGTFDDAQKKSHKMMAWPSDVNIASAGEGPAAKNGNFQVMMWEMLAKNAGYTSFTTTVNFMTFKTAKLGTTASVTAKPRLTADNNFTAGRWMKNKVGGYIGSNNVEGIEDFYTEVDKDGFEFLGASSNDWNYIADKAKFKSNVMEMITKGMDDLFADYDAVVADNK
ncbi:MAG: hypothetical protein JXR03_07765 [Cyclobacteriaceae bacterium]